jgi:peptidoglycan/xylan/chitin deacetylase (PgdA/CDA1 family)
MRLKNSLGLALAVLALAASAVQAQAAAPAAAKAPPADKNVILSFDADMTPGMQRRLATGKVAAWYDPAVVKLLEDEKLPARIYVTGLFAETYPDLVRHLTTLPGIVIGNHSYDHAAFESNCYGLRTLRTDQDKSAEITDAQAVIKRLTGVTPTLFRYPGLCRNAHDDALVALSGLTIDEGNLTSSDAFNHSSKKIVHHVMSHAQDGSEILFHLGGPNAPATAAALGRIIPRLRALGFTFRS